MKKVLVVFLAAIMMLGTVALVACENEAVYTGEYSYVAWGHTYGSKVDVTVKGDVVTAIRIYTDEEAGGESGSWVTTTKDHESVELWAAGREGFVNSLVGKTVAEINAITGTISGQGEATSDSLVGVDGVTGATQTCVRLVKAVQNALSKIPA